MFERMRGVLRRRIRRLEPAQGRRCSKKCRRTTTSPTNWRPTSWPSEPFPGYFGILYNVKRPAKNTKEAEINKAAMEKVKGLKDWQILQKTFDRLK